MLAWLLGAVSAISRDALTWAVPFRRSSCAIDYRTATGQLPLSTWAPLYQSWRRNGPENGFQPGWANITWNHDALCIEMLFRGASPRNRARSLNEATWSLGDVGEIFLQREDVKEYLELHVTPENQRLQLRWPPGGIERLREKSADLSNFAVSDPDWVSSQTRLTLDAWSACMVVPALCFGLNRLTKGMRLRGAVCRYHYPQVKSPPLLSCTAPLQAPFFHRCQDWHVLVLADAPAIAAAPLHPLTNE